MSDNEPVASMSGTNMLRIKKGSLQQMGWKNLTAHRAHKLSRMKRLGLTQLKCLRCKEIGHSESNCKIADSKLSPSVDAKLYCKSCRENGHSLINCKNSKEDGSTKNKQSLSNRNKKLLSNKKTKMKAVSKCCSKCGGRFHTAAECDKIPFCLKCCQKGHLIKDCRGVPDNVRCKHCGDINHSDKDCDNVFETVSNNSDISDSDIDEFGEENYFVDNERLSDVSDQDNDSLERVSDISDAIILSDEEYSRKERISDVFDDTNKDDTINIDGNDQQRAHSSSTSRYKRSIDPQSSPSKDLMPVLKKSKVSTSNGGANERFLRDFMSGKRSTSPDLAYVDAIIKQKEMELNDKKKRLSTETCDENDMVVKFGKQIPEKSINRNSNLSSMDDSRYFETGHDRSSERSTHRGHEKYHERDHERHGGRYSENSRERYREGTSERGHESYRESNDEKWKERPIDRDCERYPRRSSDRYSESNSERGHQRYSERSKERYDKKYREKTTEKSPVRYSENSSIRFRESSRERGYERYKESHDDKYYKIPTETDHERYNERYRERSSQDDERLYKDFMKFPNHSDQELMNDKSSDYRRLSYDRKKTQDIRILPYDRTDHETSSFNDRRLPVEEKRSPNASQSNTSADRKLLLEKKLKLMNDIEKLLEDNVDVSKLPNMDDILSKRSNYNDLNRFPSSKYRSYSPPEVLGVESKQHQSDDSYQEGLHQSDDSYQIGLHQSDLYYQDGFHHSDAYHQELNDTPVAKETTRSYQSVPSYKKTAVNNLEYEDELEDISDEDVNDFGKKRRKGPKPECKYYTKGKCNWGSKCRFPHPEDNALQYKQNDPSSLAVIKETFKLSRTVIAFKPATNNQESRAALDESASSSSLKTGSKTSSQTVNKKPGAAFYESPFGKLLGKPLIAATIVSPKKRGSSKTNFDKEVNSSETAIVSSQTAVQSQVNIPPVLDSVSTSNVLPTHDIVTVAAAHIAAVSQLAASQLAANQLAATQLAAANASLYSNHQQKVASKPGRVHSNLKYLVANESKWSKPVLKIKSKAPVNALHEFSTKKKIAPPVYDVVKTKEKTPDDKVWMECKIDGKEFTATGCRNMTAKQNVAKVAWEAIKKEYSALLSL